MESHKKPYTSPSFAVLGSDADKAEQLALAHRLNNKLGIILGECALLAQGTHDPGFLMRLETMQKTAHSMADEINTYQQRLLGVVQRAAAK
jgi:hypothetical protein